jgi:purine catabolism regulator
MAEVGLKKLWHDGRMLSTSGPGFDVRRQAVTVREALRLPALRVGVPEVIAGRESLGRPIRWVHAGEFTEMASVLKGGELLLMTGMGVPKDERAARQWLADLDACGIAGLVIELGSALATVPQAILKEARARRLPMIALHQQVAFVEVTEVLHREILGHREALLERGEETYRRLSELMLAGAGTAQVIEALAQLVGHPVVLARAGGGILFQASADRAAADVASLWESTRRGLDEVSHAVTFPVRLAGDSHWAELAVLPFDGELPALECSAVEHAVPFVALTLMREREATTLAARTRAEFLVALTEGEHLSELQATTQAGTLGFDRRAASLLPVVVGHGASAAGPTDDQWVRLADGVCQRLRSAGRPALAGVRRLSEGMLLVVGLNEGKQRAEAAAETAAAVHRLAGELSIAGGPLHVSVGQSVPTWSDVGEALRDTMAAAAAAPYRAPEEWHDVTSPDIAELLWALRGNPVLARLVEQRIQPLIEHDRRHHSSLVETLEALFASGGRKAEAARALYLERQSLYKRLARIEALLGVDLDDENTRLALHLALRARPLLQYRQAS